MCTMIDKIDFAWNKKTFSNIFHKKCNCHHHLENEDYFDEIT